MTYILLSQILGSLCLVVAVVLVFVYIERGAYARGKKSGYQSGYDQGRCDAEKWWLDAGRDVAETREKMRNEQRWP